MNDRSASEKTMTREPTPRAKELLRSLPSVSALLEHEEVGEWLHGLSRTAVTGALQAALAVARDDILSGRRMEPVEVQDVLAIAEQELVHRAIPSLRRVINATGIVLHTGLGRAPLCEAAIEAIAETAAGYCNLEYELSSGARGKRNAHVVEHLVKLTGAEAATVVNNNAAATLLILQTFASGREVLVSRGQLVEIGGSFRLPEIMSASGATLREVGTTNRTRLRDYEKALTPHAAIVMRVHPSNYRIVGFTEEVSIKELAALAHKRGAICVDDLGSGALLDLSAYGLAAEPWVGESVEAGADLVCFSGDKLLGGPQCGIIVGKAELVGILDANPLMRTYRVDKLTLAALEATLRTYHDREETFSQIPAPAMLTASTDDLAARARRLCEQLQSALPDEHFFVCSDVSFAGGGSMPTHELPTVVVQWKPLRLSADRAASALREADVPVVARIRDEVICFDLRTLRQSDHDDLVSSVVSASWPNDRDEGAVSLPIL